MERERRKKRIMISGSYLPSPYRPQQAPQLSSPHLSAPQPPPSTAQAGSAAPELGLHRAPASRSPNGTPSPIQTQVQFPFQSVSSGPFLTLPLLNWKMLQHLPEVASYSSVHLHLRSHSHPYPALVPVAPTLGTKQPNFDSDFATLCVMRGLFF
jgi:hypothetical protein